MPGSKFVPGTKHALPALIIPLSMYAAVYRFLALFFSRRVATLRAAAYIFGGPFDI